MTDASTGAAGPDLAAARAEVRALWKQAVDGGRADRTTLFAPPAHAIDAIVGRSWINYPAFADQPRHWQVVRDYFELRCPLCNTGDPELWGKSRSYREDEVLLVWDARASEDACPKCRVTRNELVERELLVGKNRLHLVWGQRAGKTTVLAAVSAFLEMRILGIAHTTPGGIQAHLGIPKQGKFAALFVAAERKQGEETIWGTYQTFRADSPWFQRYRDWVKREQELQPRAAGKKPWKYAELDSEIENGHPEVRLTARSGTSNASSERGFTRLWSDVDEISHMNQTEGRMGATELYRAVHNSLATATGRVNLFGGWPWIGSLLSGTSPVSRSDKGFKLLGETALDPHLLASHEHTWDANIYEPESNYEIRKRIDPVGVARDFGAMPPGSAYPLIPDEARFAALAVDPELAPLFTFKMHTFRDATGVTYIHPVIDQIGIPRDRELPRFLCFDAGAKKDAFAGTSMYGKAVMDEGGKPIGIDVYQDWVFRVVPPLGLQVYFEGIMPIIEKSVSMVVTANIAFDHWQSFPLVQQCRVRYGVRAEEEGTVSDDYEGFRTNGYLGRLHLLPPAPGEFNEAWQRVTPWASLSAAGAQLAELFGLQQDPDTRAVSNPAKGDERGADSDDTSRVMVHGARMVLRQGYSENQDDRSIRARKARITGQLEGWGQRGAVVGGSATRPGIRATAPTFTTYPTGGKPGRGW